MASDRRKRSVPAPRDVTRAPNPDAPLPHLEAFVMGGDGQISIGALRPIACAAVASDHHRMLAALVRRPGETLPQLLERLDRAVRLAVENDVLTDEINPPIA